MQIKSLRSNSYRNWAINNTRQCRCSGTTRHGCYPFYQGVLTIAAVNREVEPTRMTTTTSGHTMV